MTPQAGLGPAFPVFLDSACPPLPRSSVLYMLVVAPDSEHEQCIPSVNDNRSANNTLWTNQLDELVSNGTLSVALSISLDVS